MAKKPARSNSRSPRSRAKPTARGGRKAGRNTGPRSRSSSTSTSAGNPNLQRLQRVMASAGVGSRRECEDIILAGRVEVDGELVLTLGTKVDVTKQTVTVDGSDLKTQSLQYFMLNKPPGIVSTSSDPSGRMRVIDLIDTRNRVYNVGRLDKSSEGLILVTNDGDLANRLTHPKFGVEKKYHVQVVGHPNRESLRALTDGVYLAEGRAKATSVRYLRRAKDTSWIEIVLMEGRNREIRRLLAKIGHKVRTLRRVSIGTLKLGDLPVGAHRPLTPYELKSLQRGSTGKAASSKRAAAARKSTAKSKGLDEVRELAKKKPTKKSPGRSAKTASAKRKKAKTSRKKVGVSKSRSTASERQRATRGDTGRGAARAAAAKSAKRKTNKKRKR